MKISFDVQLLMKNRRTGIGWFAENILRKLPHSEDCDYQLNCFTFGYKPEQLRSIEKFKQNGYVLRKCKWFNDILFRIVSNFMNLPYYLFFGKDSNITVFFNYIIPPGVKGRKVVFIYDMVYKAHPETVRSRTKYMLNSALKKSCDRADHIITISNFSKQEIIKYLKIPENKISIVNCGVDLSIFHPNYEEEEILKTIKKYRLPRNYLLYLGTLEPRKNIERLVQAYFLLKTENPNVPKLVVAGGKGWLYTSIFEIVKSLQMEQDIIFTDYVEQEDVPVLLKGALAFLFPSIYEGFGMPPLEAMACGTPVLVSNAASLPEVVGDAGIFVDPYSIESIKNGIEIMVKDENLRINLSRKGLQRAKRFTWDNSVKIFQSILKQMS